MLSRHTEERLTWIQDGLASVNTMDDAGISKQDVRALLFEVRDLRAINAELHASLRMMEEAKDRLHGEKVDLLAALEILAGNDLNETNCASVEVAAKRVRNIARAALAGAKP